jgi:hypothetical protein
MLPWTQPVEHGSVVQQPTNFEPAEHAYLGWLGGCLGGTGVIKGFSEVVERRQWQLLTSVRQGGR